MVTIIFQTLECDACGHEAVVLDGKGTECAECDGGYYETNAGFKDIQTDAEIAEEMEENYPNQVMYVQQ